MIRIVTTTTLAGSGALLGLIGSALMVSPAALLETSGVVIQSEPGLMSELTAPAGVLIVTAALMVLGAVRHRFANMGLGAGAIVYGTYGVGRLVSMGLHGMPSQALITATLVELGLAALLAVLRISSAPARQQHLVQRSFKDAAV